MKKGLDRAFLKYGIRQPDLQVIAELCKKRELDTEWLKEQVLKRYHKAKVGRRGQEPLRPPCGIYVIARQYRNLSRDSRSSWSSDPTLITATFHFSTKSCEKWLKHTHFMLSRRVSDR